MTDTILSHAILLLLLLLLTEDANSRAARIAQGRIEQLGCEKHTRHVVAEVRGLWAQSVLVVQGHAAETDR